VRDLILTAWSRSRALQMHRRVPCDWNGCTHRALYSYVVAGQYSRPHLRYYCGTCVHRVRALGIECRELEALWTGKQ